MSNDAIYPAFGGTGADTLNGWKEIAAHLGRSVRTVQRWERAYGLPVRRVAAANAEIVWASRSDLDAWRVASGAVAAETSALPVPLPAVIDAAVPANPPTTATRSTRQSVWLALAAVAAVGAIGALTFVWQVNRSDTTGLRITPLSNANVQQGETIQLLLVAPGATQVSRWARAATGGRTEQLGDPVSVDGTGSTRWNFSSDCNTQTGEHRVWLDDGHSRRSPEFVLTIRPNPKCSEPMPDFAVHGVSAAKTTIAVGEAVPVSFTVWNIGKAAAVPTVARLRLGQESSRTRVSDVVLGDQPTPMLDAGTSVSLTTAFVVPLGVPAGTYFVWVVADNQLATLEPDSSNNYARSAAIEITPSSRVQRFPGQ